MSSLINKNNKEKIPIYLNVQNNQSINHEPNVIGIPFKKLKTITTKIGYRLLTNASDVKHKRRCHGWVGGITI